MNLEELEEALVDILPSGFHMGTDKQGQVIIYTALREEDDGELVDFEDEEEEDADPDLEPLDEDLDDDE
jgi:hypothetical protein